MNIESIKPMNDNILVRVEDGTKQTESGLTIVGEQRQRWGVVVATGPGRELGTGVREPTGVTPGCRVLYDTLLSMHRPVPGAEGHVFLKPSEVLLVEDPA